MSHFIDKRLSFSIFKDLDSFFLISKSEESGVPASKEAQKTRRVYTQKEPSSQKYDNGTIRSA